MKQRKQPRRPVLETIEPRILYAADFSPGLIDDAVLAGHVEQRSLDASGEFVQSSALGMQLRRHELVFVDPATPDYRKLLDDIRAQNGEGREMEVVVLNAQSDGVQQISAALAQRQDIGAVHILSHGSDGSVQLGSSALNFDSLLTNATQIKRWGQALTADADLLIYGCNVAGSEQGRSLIDALARLTGADVAASDDLTGATDQNGDWDLEYRSGSIEAPVAISLSAQLHWSGTLQAVAVGGETLVNTSTAGAQRVVGAPARSVAMNANGEYVVVWAGDGTQAGQTDTAGVFAQRFNANGVAQSGEFRVNTTTSNTQDAPAVAIDASGNFVVAWNSNLQDGSSLGVYAKRYSASGTVLNDEFLVNNSTAGSQSAPVIAMNASGEFVIAWEGQDGSGTGVYARRYDVSGVDQGNEFLVNSTTGGNQYMDSVAMDSAGNFVVTFSGDDGSSNGVYARRYDASNNPLSGDVLVNTYTTGDQSWSSLAMDPNGNYVVTWRSTGQDTSGGGIYAQRFDASGIAQGGEFKVNTTIANDQENPAVAMDADGNFAVVWASYGQDAGSTWGIYAQEYNADGTANGGQVRVNTTTAGDQVSPWVGMDGTGDFVVVWSGYGNQPGQSDTDSGGVFSQRYVSALLVDTAADTYDAPFSQASITINQLLSNKGGDGKISLREAIRAANNTINGGTPDRIYFDIAGAQTINLGSALPDIDDALVIDGTTDPDFAGAPIIELNGTSAGAASGLFLSGGSSGSTIRGLVINRFQQHGIRIEGSSNNTIAGNFLGTDASGTAPAGNLVGVYIHGTSSSNASANNRIGGTTAADRNIISANTVDGVQMWGAYATNNIVEGNYIGLNQNGTIDLGNTNQGVAIFGGATSNTVGGSAGNVISGNNQAGVRIVGSGTAGNLVSGNRIGTDESGTAGRANGQQGVYIGASSADNTVAGNTIAYNTWDGVGIDTTAGTGNSVSANAIFANGELGIDLGPNGVTANDGATTAGQPNLLMDFPVLQTAALSGATLTVSGYIGTAPNDTDFANATVEIFGSSEAAGTNGEGAVYLGSLSTDASGNFAGSFPVSGLAAGDRITATATDPANNTSEFGANFVVSTGSAPVASDDSYTLNEDNSLSVSWWDTAWTRRQQITFTGNNFGGAQNLSDFPVLLTLNSSGIDYTRTQNAGQDLRFLDADGTPLAYEVEKWDETGNSYVWLKVPQVDTTGADSVWMYYGNASAPAGQTPSAVWSGNGFRAVYHLSDAGPAVTDATPNAFDGTATNGPTSTGGQIGGALSFDGGNDYVNLGNDLPVLNNTGSVTLSAWVNIGSTSSVTPFIAVSRYNGGIATSNSRVAIEQAGGEVKLIARSTDDDSDVANMLTTTSPFAGQVGVWHYVTGVIDYSTNSMAIFVDGVLQATAGAANFTNSSTPNTNSADASIGSQDDGSGGYFPGSIDEARIAGTARSAAWIEAEYLTMTGGFLTVGTAQVAPGTAGVLSNDTSYNGQPLTAVLVSGPTHAASFTLNADGTFNYAPVANYAGGDLFTYRANDGGSNSSTATVTLTISPVNDSPANTAPGAQSTNEDVSLTFSTANGNALSVSDVDAAVLQVTLAGGNGALTLAGTAGLTFIAGDGVADAVMTLSGSAASINAALDGLSFAPSADFSGAATLQIDTSDLGASGSGGILNDSDIVSIAVNPVNDAPTLANLSGDAQTYAEGGGRVLIEQGGDATVMDPDSANFDTGTLTVSITAGGDSSEDVLTIRNQGGAAGEIGLSGGNVTYAGMVIGTAAGGSSGAPLTVSFNANATPAALSALVRNITYENADTDNPTTGARALTFVVNDGDGGTSLIHTAAVSVSSVNDDPVSADDAVGTDEDTALNVAGPGVLGNDSDVDGGALTVSAVEGNPANVGAPITLLSGALLTLNANGSFSYDPNGVFDYLGAGDTDTDGFSYEVSDGNGGTSTASVIITISGANDAPTGSDATVTTGEDSGYVFDSSDFGFVDADAADTLQSVIIVSPPGAGTLLLGGVPVGAGQVIAEADVTNGDLMFTPDAHGNGAGYASFTFRLSDGTVSSTPVNTVTIDVTAVNDEPSFVMAGNDISAEDAGAQTVAGFASASAGGAADEAGQSFSYTLTNDNNALFSLQPSIDASGNLIYTAAANAFGSATVTVYLSDSGGVANGGDDASSTQTFLITVSPVNDAPTGAVTVSGTSTEDQTLTADTSSVTDADGIGAFSHQWARSTDGGGTWGVIAGATAATYTLGDADVGSLVRVVVSYTDAQGTAESLTSAAVGPVANGNDAPVAVDDNGVTAADTVLNIAPAGVLGNDSDVDPDALNVIAVQGSAASVGSVVSLASGALLTVNADGSFSYDPNGAFDMLAAGASGIDSFTYTVGDGNGGSDTASMIITINGVNDAPVGADATITTLEDMPYVFAFGDFAFADVDTGDSLQSVTVTSLPGAGSLMLSGAAVAPGQSVSLAQILAGSLGFTPAPNANGTGYASFAVQVNDGVVDAAVPSIATINVAPVNDAPLLSANSLTVSQSGTVALSGADVGAIDVDNAAITLEFSVSNVSNGRFELMSAPGVAITRFTQAQVSGGQVRFVHDGSASAPSYQLQVSDGALIDGPMSANVNWSPTATGVGLISSPDAPSTAPAVGEPPAVSEAPVRGQPPSAPPASQESTPQAAFSPGRPEAMMNETPAQAPRLVTIERAPLRIVPVVQSFNDYEPAPPADIVMQVLNVLPSQLQFTSSKPMDWVVSPAFEEGFGDKAERELQVLIDSVKFGGMALSVGAVWWASRISGLLGSLLASTPAWRHIDPLPVVGRDDEEEDWYEPDDRDADANELAVSLVLEGGARAGPSAD